MRIYDRISETPIYRLKKLSVYHIYNVEKIQTDLGERYLIYATDNRVYLANKYITNYINNIKHEKYPHYLVIKTKKIKQFKTKKGRIGQYLDLIIENKYRYDDLIFNSVQEIDDHIKMNNYKIAKELIKSLLN